ncbi:hypothetical protein [Insulibacter thermoxylanivorax]|nr:hypothetical protein [Insulibacter thermoxylanivorax]
MQRSLRIRSRALTTAYGTGIRDSELKVLNADLEELPEQVPRTAVESLVEARLDRHDHSRTYTFVLNGEERSFTYEESDAGMWFDTPVFGNTLRYRAEDGAIYADVSVQVSLVSIH